MIYSYIQLLHKNKFATENKSTSKNHSAYMKICTALDKKKHAMEMFLDLSKPFDTVNHQILLSKITVKTILIQFPR